jgi:DNA-directed RNA polymerase subunit RPC12/RpoP
MNLRIYTYALPPLKPALRETRERRCPYCRGDAVVPAGYVIGVGGMIKVEYRCTVCETAFLVVREALI